MSLQLSLVVDCMRKNNVFKVRYNFVEFNGIYGSI